MAKKKAEDQAVSTNVMPTYLQEYTGDTGTEGMGEFIRPPRLKVIQKQSSDELLDKFNVGDVVAMPQQILIAEKGQTIGFVPIFFYPEWVVMNPYEMKATLPMMRARTLDRESEIAKRARNKDMWYAPCPENEEHQIRYAEILNFLIMLRMDHGLADTPIMLSFSTSEHITGTSFMALLRMRKAPMFACQFEMKTGRPRSNDSGQWQGLDVYNPEHLTPFIEDEEEFAVMQHLHEEFKALHAKDSIIVEHGDDDVKAEDDEDSAF